MKALACNVICTAFEIIVSRRFRVINKQVGNASRTVRPCFSAGFYLGAVQVLGGDVIVIVVCAVIACGRSYTSLKAFLFFFIPISYRSPAATCFAVRNASFLLEPPLGWPHGAIFARREEDKNIFRLIAHFFSILSGSTYYSRELISNLSWKDFKRHVSLGVESILDENETRFISLYAKSILSRFETDNVLCSAVTGIF